MPSVAGYGAPVWKRVLQTLGGIPLNGLAVAGTPLEDFGGNRRAASFLPFMYLPVVTPTGLISREWREQATGVYGVDEGSSHGIELRRAVGFLSFIALPSVTPNATPDRQWREQVAGSYGDGV